ncbi:ATP-dependent nuclease [Edwardsiella piscicida]|uniref:ATP-dependent nuclease n=1 Tax=Edwardsiella piscicida TaxID=1263550 RepID=UPI00370D0BC4
MDLLKIKIKNVKNIKNADVELPIEGGVYSLVGGNGCGKSTLMLIISVLVSNKRYNMFQSEDYTSDSIISLSACTEKDVIDNVWYVNSKNNKWQCTTRPMYYKGVYEGSLFYGSRFEDSRSVDKLLRSKKISSEQLVDAFDYVKEHLSFILHGDREHYKTMRKIKNKRISESLELSNLPYFMETDRGTLLSQYRMSSGECLLISLLNYIYCSLINQGGAAISEKTSLILIDEIELALHPIAISRLISYLNELTVTYPKLCVYLTSHSPEVIRSLKPENMFMINNNFGELTLINPCFPSYAIREVYRHDGFDHLILAEDVLASHIIDKVLSDNGLKNSRLVHISPVGGWQNVLNLHMDLLKNNVMGVNRKIISVLDGDVKSEVSAKPEYKNLPKLFLPIQSVEKLIYDIVFNKSNDKLKKIINDKYFTIKSLDDLQYDHNQQYKTTPKNPDKVFYFRIKKDLENRNINESAFVRDLSDDIRKAIDFTSFAKGLISVLS